MLTSSIFLICCNALCPLSAHKSNVHTRPHPCPWVCPPDRLTVHIHRFFFLLSSMCLLIYRFLLAYRLSFFPWVRSVSQSYFSKFTITIAIFFLHAWSMLYRIFSAKSHKNYHNFTTSSLRNLLMTVTSFCFQSVVIAGWGQHFPQVVLNHSAKNTPRRQSRRLQRNLKYLRRMERLLVMKQQHFPAPKTGA